MCDHSKNEVILRSATKEDMQDVVNMIQELADLMNMSDRPKLKAEDLVRDGFGKQPAFYCKIAETQEKRAVGCAIYLPIYSTWEGKAMMLQNLYVTPKYRNKGVGSLLFNEIAKETALMGCSRLDWRVLEWNPACAFYEHKGAVNLTSTEKWCLFRLSGDALSSFA